MDGSPLAASKRLENMASVSVLDSVVVDDVVVFTSVGESVREVFAATATGLRREHQITVDRPGAGETERKKITCFPIADAGIPEISIRLHTMLAPLTGQLAKRIGVAGSGKVRFHLMLPSETSSRARFINSKSIHQLITQLDHELGECEFRWSHEETGAAATLEECCRAVSSGEVDTAVFGGIDTLVNFGTVTEFFRNGRIPKDPAAGCASPGEAAAFVVLRNAKDAVSRSASDAIYVGGISSSDEPQVGQAEKGKLAGLSTSINTLLTSLGVAPSDLLRVIHNLQGENSSAFEWLQVENAVWPNRLPEELRQAMHDGEMEAPDNPEESKLDTLGLVSVLGDTGAASLPLSIGLGVGKLDYYQRFGKFQLPFVDDLLVVDAGHTPARGAVYLRRGSGGGSGSLTRMN